MEKKIADEQRWALPNSTQNAVKIQDDIEDEDEEALSLSDLPLIHNNSRKENENNPMRGTDQTQDDFDFCSMSKESEMCAADELFFQGQILPFRHSVSSEKGLLQCYETRSVSRSESMDRCYSGGFISSRSSSISSSHQSSSSGSSAAAMGRPTYQPKLPPRNVFHSHPSPSPKLRFSTKKQGIINHNKKSPAWNIFRLGLVTPPPEIAFLKNRPSNNSTNRRNLGSRNSTSSNSSSFSSNGDKNVKKKIKPRALLSGCKCSVDTVDTVPSKIVIFKRSASGSEEEVNEQEAKLTKQQATKKQISHHRTFEWLKQLSIEGAADRA
ncbi:hypothetical protein BUALT_Bualt04G0104400 [Buddleja alternifolia]|uniref:Uncharacterized protein n=1 Tax=Buddleja alternifolia TaxID=168488 RepID=A0AAV6XVB3_9LAMI|nr:hypothetical protein BUALT_Bualt04G0104400 [Buddleja alternifolia]